MISIWFFIGVALLVNGLLILVAGIAEILRPPANPGIVLFNLHANAWWGALLTVVGLIYCYFFSPKRAKG
jgi:FtsH-binding integral membrane protein